MKNASKLISGWLMGALWLCAGQALAHPDLDEGKRLAAELEFEPALAAFEHALSSGGLTRPELVDLLAERALLLHALHRQNDLIEDFVWLSALAPEHRLDLRAPPELTALWTSVRDQGRGALKVELSAQPDGRGGLDARANLSGTVPEGARARLALRQPGGSWQSIDASELHEALPAAGLELYAEALGLGSVVVAQDHSADAPLRIDPLAAQPEAGEGTSERAPRWAKRHRGWLIGGAAAVAAIVVVSAIVAARAGSDGGHSDSTNLKPMVSF